MVPKMKGFIFFNRIFTQRDSVSSFSRSSLLAKSILSLMYNLTPPPWPLFRSRLMKLYPQILKKALWKSSLIEVSDQLNMLKLYDNKISWTSSIFPYKPLIFWWQNLIPFFDMSVLNSLLLVRPCCDSMSPHSSYNNKHTSFFVVVTCFNFIQWNVDKTKLSRPSYKSHLWKVILMLSGDVQ